MISPLAERMRPKNLQEYIGQKHIVGENGVVKKALESGFIPSMILWGPPGVGKTTLASLLADELKMPFYSLSAINSGVKEVRETIAKAENANFFNRNRPILFIDEIHRFSKSQQDSLLGAVEKGIVTLIGATTENPSFEVISALLSRCQVYVLQALEVDELKSIVVNSISHDEFLRKLNITISSYASLIKISGGDARKLLNALELVVSNCDQSKPIMITDELVDKIIGENLVLYDKSGEQHYDLISAFIKSMRGSDPDATVYYLARMLSGGEDPLFICRRMIILASEDIGLANPNALLLANACFQSVHQIGMPEARIIMSQTAIYLANSSKSNSAYLAINEAMSLVAETGNLPVPLHLRNAPTKLMKELGYGKDYKYAHSFPDNRVDQQHLPDKIKSRKIYIPGNNPMESKSKK
ncbi:MAG TPA: replication-associated recombination protein A [Saprospiraceae bacterium]|nr:replication-associated recombination protein A [Saprospiraceae bacterium]